MPSHAEPAAPSTVSPVRRNSGASLHHQVYLVLHSAIVSGQYSLGERLPSEEELCKRFDVARVTVRTALETLKKEDLIETKRGSGTVVKHRRVQEKVRIANVELMRHLRWVVASTSVRLLKVDRVTPTTEMYNFFACSDDETLQRIVRLRFEGGKALFHVTTMLAPWIDALSERDAKRQSLTEMLEERGLRAAGGRQVISATAADPDLAEHLGTPVGAPLVYVRRFQYDQERRPMQVLEIRAVPQFFEVEMTLSSD
jgi:DNA-binding GntR family transcriptional regulator